ncbi:MAG: HAMP domain-containing protein, partial [candidate division Zixibacteria bacterium]|nr:HAMP domain-containing protein [candidate division Zixibacteria bacterium]
FYLAVLVVALTAVFGYQDIVRERRLLESMIGGKGRALVETLAIPVTNTLLYEELGLVEEGGMLDNYVEGLIADESLGIVYAEVLDTKGSVIAHSDPSELGAARSDPETLPILSTWETTLRKSKILHDNQMISVLHIATPLAISSKRWGSLRVGVSLEPLRKRVLTATLRIVIFSLASVTCVVVAVALLFRAMTGPMKKLALAMERVAAGASPDLSTDLRRDDEVGILQRRFASMLEKLRKAEEDRELTQKRLAFAEKMASIGKLTAAISHEINNPLSGLLHCVKAFKKRSLPERKKKEYLSLMEDGVQRIQKRVKDLLEYARPHDLRLVPANINQLVEKALSFLDFPLKNAGISIETHLEDRVAAEM